MYKLPNKGKLEYLDDGRVICHICGNAFDKLGAHVYHTHKITSEKYKQQFGLNKNTKLTSKNYQAHMQQYITDDTVHFLQVAGEDYQFKKGSKGRTRDKIAEQELNRLKERSKNGIFRKVLNYIQK